MTSNDITKRGTDREDLVIRLCRRSENGLNGCVNWTGSSNGYGYGTTGIGSILDGTRRMVVTHRLSASIWLGFDLASPLCVLHKCDNPRCINPDHLFIGTRGINNSDCKAKGRTAKGEINGGCKLTTQQIVEIQASHASGVKQRRIAKDFNVSTASVCLIVNGKRWSHVAPIS
jgi:hypothetical protein